MPLLDPVHRLTVHPRKLGEPLLGEVGVETDGSDRLADSPAAVEDPVVGRWSRRHPTTLA